MSTTKKNNSDIYTHQEVKDATVEYFDGDEMAADNWINKYAVRKGKEEFLEKTPLDMHIRMAREFARIEKKYDKWLDEEDYLKLSDLGKKYIGVSEEKILELFDKFKYVIPQGSVMSILGNNGVIGSLSNCIVIDDVIDSYGGICYTDQQLAQLFKRRCGVGVDISKLRPSDEPVSNAAGSTTGSVSFCERFSRTTEEVGQNGRRGALMLTMSVSHPDIFEFIKVKQNEDKVTGANLSIRLTDEFMKAVEKDEDYSLRWPVDKTPEEAEVVKEVKAKELWDEIISSARNFAEPGLMFWDRHHEYSTSSVYPDYKNVSTNPCGEIAMQKNDSCRLVALNLYSFVDNPFTKEASFNYDRFFEITYIAQKLNDDLVDLEIERIDCILNKIKSDPEPDSVKQVEIETWKNLKKSGEEGRRTGLGITGLGDTIAAMNMKYDSDDACDFVESIMRTKCESEFSSSVDMAISRGKFKDFDSKYENKSKFVKMLRKEFPDLASKMAEVGRRNISISTCAPTGTLSTLTRTTSGIEPAYCLTMVRKRRFRSTENDNDDKNIVIDDRGNKWVSYEICHPKLDTWKEVTGEDDLEKSPYYGATAEEIEWEKRVRLQGVIQKYVTHSISSTINLPSDATTETVGGIYWKAWKDGLKGVTVYRDGSRQGILSKVDDRKNNKIIYNDAPTRPKILPCDIHYSTIQGDPWIFFVSLLGDCPYEVFGGCREEVVIPNKYKTAFIKKNSKDEKGRRKYDLYLDHPDTTKPWVKDLGGEFEPEEESRTRFLSMSLRHGVPIQFICEQLHKSTPTNMFSFEKGVSRVLKKYINNGAVSSIRCRTCGSKLTYSEGCVKCLSCGESYCM